MVDKIACWSCERKVMPERKFYCPACGATIKGKMPEHEFWKKLYVVHQRENTHLLPQGESDG